MIRPLIYCETISHIRTSIDTIDCRILELIALRESYLKKQQELNDNQHQSEKNPNLPREQGKFLSTLQETFHDIMNKHANTNEQQTGHEQ